MPFTVTPGWAWILLLLAGMLEVVWVLAMKASRDQVLTTSAA